MRSQANHTRPGRDGSDDTAEHVKQFVRVDELIRCPNTGHRADHRHATAGDCPQGDARGGDHAKPAFLPSSRASARDVHASGPHRSAGGGRPFGRRDPPRGRGRSASSSPSPPLRGRRWAVDAAPAHEALRAEPRATSMRRGRIDLSDSAVCSGAEDETPVPWGTARINRSALRSRVAAASRYRQGVRVLVRETTLTPGVAECLRQSARYVNRSS